MLTLVAPPDGPDGSESWHASRDLIDGKGSQIHSPTGLIYPARHAHFVVVLFLLLARLAGPARCELSGLDRSADPGAFRNRHESLRSPFRFEPKLPGRKPRKPL